MSLYDYQVEDLKKIKKLLDALHEIANPSFEDPAAATAIWIAVRKALEGQSLNYADIIRGQVSISFVLDRLSETENV